MLNKGMLTSVEVICPDTRELECEETGKCVCHLCGKCIANKSALNLHLAKVHLVGEVARYRKGNTSGRIKTVYCCPVKGCPRGAPYKNRHFKNIWHVRQHYLNCHAERKQECPKCHAKFGTINRRKQHEKSCGKIFNCSCGCPFTTREALLTHARIQGHLVDAQIQDTIAQSCDSDYGASNKSDQTKRILGLGSKRPKLLAVPMVMLIPNQGYVAASSKKSDNDPSRLPSIKVQFGKGAEILKDRGKEQNQPLQPQMRSTRGILPCERPQMIAYSPNNNIKPAKLVAQTCSWSQTTNLEEINLTDVCDVSDAFTQTKQQSFGNQFSQTGSQVFTDISETQTQTLSLEAFLGYHSLNDAFTQTSQVEVTRNATQSEDSTLAEIETQTTSDFMNLLQDAFTQTLQQNNSDQCSQTNSSLFNMMSGTTQTQGLHSLRDFVPAIQPNEYDLFSVDPSTEFSMSKGRNSLAEDTGFHSRASMPTSFVENEEFSSEDSLNDAFTQTWSQCSIDQFSQTSWSDYIQYHLLQSAATGEQNREVDDQCVDLSENIKAPEKMSSDPFPSKACSSLLDSCTQTNVSFGYAVNSTCDNADRGIMTPPPYCASAGTQTRTHERSSSQ